MVIRIPDQRTARGGYAALDDRMLVLDFQAGNLEAFVEIHRRYGGLARHVCQRFLPNQADADEALQETMIRVFQGLYRFNGRYALQPWIARIAKNVSLDILRGRARRPQLDDSAPAADELPDPTDEADRIVERLVQRDTVLAVLADLPETHRRALVMREIDGASHREIAHELEITAPQAKALLHRAKAGFRKRWLERVADRAGILGFAFVPLLWLARGADAIRRLGDRAGQAAGHAAQTAQAIAPEVVTSSVTTAAPNTISMAERVVAAGMTLLVAGGVTVGAAKVVRDRNKPEPAAVAAAAAVVTESAPETSVEVVSPVVEPRKEREHVDVAPVVVEPLPSVEPSPTVEPTVEPAPDPSPSGDPTPTVDPTPSGTPPPIPPAPAWSGSFLIGWPSEDLCGCGPGVSATSLNSTGGLLEADGRLLVDQSLSGAAQDAEGDAAWGLRARIRADLTAGAGSAQLSFSLERDGAVTSYLGTAQSTSVEGSVAEGEAVTYVMTGAYTIVGAGADESPIRTAGSLTVALTVWQDGTSVILSDLRLGG